MGGFVGEHVNANLTMTVTVMHNFYIRIPKKREILKCLLFIFLSSSFAYHGVLDVGHKEIYANYKKMHLFTFLTSLL